MSQRPLKPKYPIRNPGGDLHFFSASAFFREAGTAKSALSIGTFTSILLTVVVCAPGFALDPCDTEYGYMTPCTGLYEPISITLSRTEPRMNSCTSFRISRYVSGSRK